MTSLDMRSNSAVMKRAEQLKRWEESDTNQAPSAPRPEKGRKIKFSSGCVFLAACSSGDKDEVLSLLENGADINTANVDGLTALHQACIDDNLEMVEFLVEHGADINRQDNEGWTPLHATASCGFVSIARYLVEHGADVAAVNSDGDLAVDLAVDIQHMPMIEYMQKVVNEHNIDLQKAREAELDQMLKDAKQWLRSDASEADKVHPKTGATALHVAAAKGYTKVLSLLLAGRANVDKQDNDGWTPLHAAAHWGQREAAEMLVNAMADMDIRNYSGLTCIDVADRKMVKFLEELRASNKRTKRRPSSQIRISDTIENHNQGSKIIRVEVKPDQTKEQANDEKPKNTTESTAVFKAPATDPPTEDEAPWRRNSLARVRTQNDSPTKNQVPDKDVSKSNTNTETSDVILRRTQSFENDEKFYQKYNELRARIKANSCPILPATEISNSNNSNSNNNNNNNNNNINNNNNNNESNINRISSNAPPSSVALARLYLTTTSASTISPAITSSTTSTTSITTTTTITPTSTIPVQINTVQRSASLKDHRSIRKQLTSPPASPANVANVGNHTITSTTTNTTTTNTAVASGAPIRRSFVPPVRDEESETQRKAHAKRVRETRRSTQGVTLDEIKSAEELVKKKNANMNNNNNSGNIMDPTKPVSMQENVTTFEQQADECGEQPESMSSTSSISTSYQHEVKKDKLSSPSEIEDHVEKTLPVIPFPMEAVMPDSSCSSKILHSTISPNKENTTTDNSSTNDNSDQESDKEGSKLSEKDNGRNKETAISSQRMSYTTALVTESTNNDKNSNSSTDENDEICVNFTIKRNDTVAPAVVTVESVEETVTVGHPMKTFAPKKPIEAISNLDSVEKVDLKNSAYEVQHISPLPGNMEQQKNQSITNENDSNINVYSSTETEKTDLIEKTPTSKTILIQDLDGNSSEFMIPSVASTTSLIKRMRATASSMSSLIHPTDEQSESTETITVASPSPSPSTPTLESPVRLRDKRSLFDLEKRYPETQKQLYETSQNTSQPHNSITCNNSEEDAESIFNASISVSNDNKTIQQSSSLPNSPMYNRESPTAGGNNVNTSSYSGITTTERRPSWRLKFSNDSKFKLEDVNTGATFPPNNTTIIPSAPAVIAAANQRRINSVGNTISSSNQSLNSIGRPVSAPVSAIISNANNNTGSNAGFVLSSGDNNASNEKPNDNSNNTSSIGGVAGRKFNVTIPASINVTSSSTIPTTMVSTNTTAKSSKEDNDNDKENDSRSALATQAVIQRRRKPKRRSTGVVHLDMDDLDPERQDSANDADEKESGSEQRSSRTRVGSTAASSSNTSAATKNDIKSQNQTENGEPDYKALWQAARLENDQLKLELLKKEEQLVQTNAAMSRITNATTKNSLSELEKRERRAMERKLSELEEELKQLDFYKAENLRLKEENGALIRVISKLSK